MYKLVVRIGADLINWSPHRPINRFVTIIEFVQKQAKMDDFLLKFQKIIKKNMFILKEFKIDYENDAIDMPMTG